MCGLLLDEWQQHVLTEALGVRADGFWSAFEVGLICPRQNGKNAIVEALELAGLVLWPSVMVHSAHKFDTASEHFKRMQQLVTACDEVNDLVGQIHIANGKEAIEMRSGARLKFLARSRGAARGHSGDLLVLDEAFDLSGAAVGAMLPALSARPNPQVWYTSSAPHADSDVLHAVRDRARSADPGRLAFFEWGNEPDVDPLDREAWARANPALGIRIAEEFIEAEQRSMPADEFGRERLGVANAPDMFASVIPVAEWDACRDSESSIDGAVSLALDVNPERSWASFAAAGVRPDGLVHVEVVDRREGTRWVVERALELSSRWDVPIALDPRSPAGGLISELLKVGVQIVEVSGLDLAQACAGFQDAVLNGRIAHIGQVPLDAAVAGASTRKLGEAWAWSRLSSQVDVAPLVAVTIAFARVGEQHGHEFAVELAIH